MRCYAIKVKGHIQNITYVFFMLPKAMYVKGRHSRLMQVVSSFPPMLSFLLDLIPSFKDLAPWSPVDFLLVSPAKRTFFHVQSPVTFTL